MHKVFTFGLTLSIIISAIFIGSFKTLNASSVTEKINVVDISVNANKKDVVEALKTSNIKVLTVTESKKDKFEIPDIQINGAETPIAEGEIIVLTAEIKNKPAYLESTTYSWVILENNKEKMVMLWPDNTKVFWGAGLLPKNVKSKQFLAVLHVNFLYLVKDDKGQILEAHTKTSKPVFKEVFVGTAPIPPGPDPVPPDPTPPVPPTPPDPVIPDGVYNISKPVYNWIMKDKVIPLTGGDLTSSAAASATAYKNIASSIAAGAYKTLSNNEAITKILQDTKTNNNSMISKIGVDPKKWDKFGENLQKFVFDLYKNKTIKSAEDFMILYREIALGLEMVK